MQTLDFDMTKDPLNSKHMEYDIPQGSQGIGFRVVDGKDGVILSVDGKEVMLSIGGARDLAMALRQSANRVERYRR